MWDYEVMRLLFEKKKISSPAKNADYQNSTSKEGQA